MARSDQPDITCRHDKHHISIKNSFHFPSQDSPNVTLWTLKKSKDHSTNRLRMNEDYFFGGN